QVLAEAGGVDVADGDDVGDQVVRLGDVLDVLLVGGLDVLDGRDLLDLGRRQDLEDAAQLDDAVPLVLEDRVEQADGLLGGDGVGADDVDPAVDSRLGVLDDGEPGFFGQVGENGVDGRVLEVHADLRRPGGEAAVAAVGVTGAAGAGRAD